MYKAWLILLLLCTANFLYAQSANKKAEANYREALELYKNKDYKGAHAALYKSEELDRGFPELYLLRADIYNREKNTEGEITSIRKAFSLDSLKYTSYYYLLADCYYSVGDYSNALVFYDQYIRKDKKQNWFTAAKRKIENCRFAHHALQTQKKQPVVSFIQSEQDVYWPSLDVTGETVLYTKQDEGGENIWMRKDGKDYFLNLNTTENEGTQSLTADGKMMYFTTCGRPDGRGSCDIYVAYRISDTVWSAPINLGYPVNTDAWEAQPAISADGTKLFFASNREGGRGGSDIWFSRLLSREVDGRQVWSYPLCLYFNTPAQEMAPFLYYDNNILFFASDGYPGMGGMDIYRADLNRVNEPVNVGITVNTCKDEMGFTVDASGNWGYFASDVNGPKNIFKYRLTDSISCDPMSYVRLVVRAKDGGALKPDRLTVVIPETKDTLAFYDGLYVYNEMLVCIPANRLLLVSAEKEGYMYYSDTLYTAATDREHPLYKKIVLHEIRPGETLVLKGVFFDVDDYRLKPESVMELQQLAGFMSRNPDVKIEISGHTDNTGSVEHNYELSESRAFEVYKYLFVNRINKNRMIYKGYGKDKPVASNEDEAGRAVNRRTEIKIVE